MTRLSWLRKKFCNPKLDDNIMLQKGTFNKSGLNVSPFHREQDNVFRRMDYFCNGSV